MHSQVKGKSSTNKQSEIQIKIQKILPLLEKSIAKQQGKLVSLAKKRGIAQAFQNSGLEESGLRNVLDVAKESSHVAVVTNFLRYQVGRDAGPSPTKWAVTMKCDKHSMSIGECVADDIEHTIARDMTAEVLERIKTDLDSTLPPAISSTIIQQAAIHLTRSYLGYLLRAFVSVRNKLGREEYSHV